MAQEEYDALLDSTFDKVEAMGEEELREELEAAKEMREEAKRQGDTITYICRDQYIHLLKETLE